MSLLSIHNCIDLSWLTSLFWSDYIQHVWDHVHFCLDYSQFQEIFSLFHCFHTKVIFFLSICNSDESMEEPKIVLSRCDTDRIKYCWIHYEKNIVMLCLRTYCLKSRQMIFLKIWRQSIWRQQYWSKKKIVKECQRAESWNTVFHFIYKWWTMQIYVHLGFPYNNNHKICCTSNKKYAIWNCGLFDFLNQKLCKQQIRSALFLIHILEKNKSF